MQFILFVQQKHMLQLLEANKEGEMCPHNEKFIYNYRLKAFTGVNFISSLLNEPGN